MPLIDLPLEPGPEGRPRYLHFASRATPGKDA
jgi:hypothetical protein